MYKVILKIFEQGSIDAWCELSEEDLIVMIFKESKGNCSPALVKEIVECKY